MCVTRLLKKDKQPLVTESVEAAMIAFHLLVIKIKNLTLVFQFISELFMHINYHMQQKSDKRKQKPKKGGQPHRKRGG